ETGGQAAGETDEEILDRGNPDVRSGEDLGMIGIEHGFSLVSLLASEAEEVLDRRGAVDALLPLRRRLPGELRRIRRPCQGLTRIEPTVTTCRSTAGSLLRSCGASTSPDSSTRQEGC